MGKIDIELLAEGMILEDPVKDLHGRVLMKEGSLVSEKSIRILKMWGVVEVTVVNAAVGGQEGTSASAIDPHLVELAEIDAKILFSHTDRKSPFVEELYRLITHRIAKGRAKGAANVQ